LSGTFFQEREKMPHPSTSQQAPIRGSGTKCRKCGGVILHEWEHCADCDTHLDDQDEAIEMDALGPQRKAVIRPVALKVKGATPSRGTPKAQSAARPAAPKPKLDPNIDLSSRFEPEPIKRSFPTGLVAAIAAAALVFVVGIGGAMFMSGGDETAAAPVATATATPVLAAATATPAATPTVVAVATPAPKAAVAAKGKKGKKVASAKSKKKSAHKQVASASSGLPF
jgi:hypothetical protein